jgi:hypothetical protein
MGLPCPFPFQGSCQVHFANLQTPHVIFVGGYFANLSLPVYQLQFCQIVKSTLPNDQIHVAMFAFPSHQIHTTKETLPNCQVHIAMYASPTHLIHFANATLPNCQSHMPYLHSQLTKSTLPKIAKYTSPFELPK